MKRLRIGCDMDAILVDLLGLWLNEIHETHGVKAHPDEICHWDMSKCASLAHLGSVTIADFLRRPGFYERAPSIAGALMSLSFLHAIRGHGIQIVTATPGRWGPVVDADVQDQKRRWLAKHLPWIVPEAIIFTSAKEKAKYEFDVFIEDNPDTLITYQDRHPKALVIGIEYPYNRYVSALPPGVDQPVIHLARGHNNTIAAWNQIVDLIDDHARSP